MSFTDFQAGLQSASDYLGARHHLNGTTALGNDALRIVGMAQYSFTLRELLCGILSGNGLKLPNLQICIHANIAALLGLPNLQGILRDALNELNSAFERFMDHTKIDDILGRLNAVLAEAQNVANLINFCATPVDPIAIPNMLERAFGSFLGAGKSIIDSIGSMAPSDVCGCIGTNGFNTNVFNGGILGVISSNFADVTNGTLSDEIISSIRNDITSVVGGITNLINFENNINGSYLQGGSQFATPDSGCNSEVGVMHNPNSGTIASNARITSTLKALYDVLGGYPVRYVYNKNPETNGPLIISGSASGSIGEEITYPNIFHLLLDPELLSILDRNDDPTPNISNQTPVYDYCGSIIGYTTNYIQQEQQQSEGSIPTQPNSPGHNAGGLPTNTTTTSDSAIIQNTTVEYNFSGSGSSTIYYVSSESAQVALQPNTNDIVVRTDILTIFFRKDTSVFNTGTMSDYQQGSVTFTNFGNNINNLSGTGFIAKDGNTAIARIISGTVNEIEVINGNGSGGNVVIGLSDNTVIPGNSAIKIPTGTTAQRETGESGRLRYNVDLNRLEAYYGDIGVWRSIANTSDITTSATTLINIGSGSSIFKQLNTSNQNEIRKLNSSGLISITQNANDITIGDTLSASNVGAGTGLFYTRNSNVLQFKSLTTTNGNIIITDNSTSVDISGDHRIKYSSLQTTNGTTTNVTFEGVYPAPDTDKSWFFTIEALAGNIGTTRRAFKIEGVVQNNSGSASLVGTNTKIDYQRGTADISSSPWDAGVSYVTGNTVEYDLVIYQATTNISAYQNTPDINPNWIATYTGWNVSAVTIGSPIPSFKIQVRGESATVVNWSLRLSYIEL
jgi:hypothetical protein